MHLLNSLLVFLNAVELPSPNSLKKITRRKLAFMADFFLGDFLLYSLEVLIYFSHACFNVLL